jgi:hypothetical protein
VLVAPPAGLTASDPGPTAEAVGSGVAFLVESIRAKDKSASAEAGSRRSAPGSNVEIRQR